MSSRLRHLTKEWLLKRGMLISRPPGQFSIPHLKLSAAKGRGLVISSAIDGGAADGSWTRAFRRIYPGASVLCIEPREECAADLQQLICDLTNVRHAALCVRSHQATVEVNVHGDQNSTLENSLGERFGTLRTYPITRLDELVRTTGFPWPDLIKLDLQGGELDALSGATECLDHAQVLFLEASLFPFQKHAPLLHDVVVLPRS